MQRTILYGLMTVNKLLLRMHLPQTSTDPKAILYQNGKEIVLSYYSKSFSKSEKNYCVTRCKLLAIVASVNWYHY